MSFYSEMKFYNNLTVDGKEKYVMKTFVIYTLRITERKENESFM